MYDPAHCQPMSLLLQLEPETMVTTNFVAELNIVFNSFVLHPIACIIK
jgi:hypothetical protein